MKILATHHTPVAFATAPGRFVLVNIDNGYEYVTGWQNLEDAKLSDDWEQIPLDQPLEWVHGHYFETLEDARMDFIKRIEKWFNNHYNQYRIRGVG